MTRKVSFDYELINEFDYFDDNTKDVEKAKSLKFMAPTSRQLGICLKLKQAFMCAIKETTKDLKDKKPSTHQNSEETITGPDIENLFLMSSEIDLEEIHLLFKKLIVSSNDKSTYRGVCIVEGKTLLTEALYNEICTDDIETMLGEYIANFLLPSALKKKK
jgi:hypothetical protein